MELAGRGAAASYICYDWQYRRTIQSSHRLASWASPKVRLGLSHSTGSRRGGVPACQTLRKAFRAGFRVFQVFHGHRRGKPYFSCIAPPHHRLPIILPLVVRRMSSAAMPYAREQAVALSAVLKASILAQKVHFELIGSGGVTKKDKSPVTGE